MSMTVEMYECERRMSVTVEEWMLACTATHNNIKIFLCILSFIQNVKTKLK